MGAIMGFAIGFYVGTREGEQGLVRIMQAWDYISKSDDFKALVSNASSMGAGLLKSGLKNGKGGMYPALAEGVVDMLARRRAA